jgi:Uma2 family endonuclease
MGDNATTSKPTRKRRIPDYLVKEVIDGIAFYYPGYKDVLSKKKTKEDIMGWSGLQGVIVGYFTSLFTKLDRKKYWAFPGETGIHLGFKNNLSLDLAIFERSVLTPDKITTRYIDVPASCVIEIDVQAEWEDDNMNDMAFIDLKTRKLFEFGTKKLIWVLSRSQKVLVAEPGQDWTIIDWNKDIELLDGLIFNIGQYLKEEGIVVE